MQRLDASLNPEPTQSPGDGGYINAVGGTGYNQSLSGQTITLTGDASGSGVTSIPVTIDTFAGSSKGLVPASPGGSTKFLRADGSWVVPAGGGGGSGITRLVSSVATPTTAGADPITDYVYFVSGTTTLTLPTAVTNTNRYTVKNTGSNTVTIATTSAQTIDGSATATLTPNTSLDLVSDNANWRLV